jgi:hypothetical protein
MSRELLNQLIEKVREIPTRPGNIGGQNYKYVRLEEVIGLLLDALDSYEAKPLPEPFTYIGYSAFEKLSSGYAVSVFCSKHAMTNRDIPLYTEPPARSPLSDDEIVIGFGESGQLSLNSFEAGARWSEEKHGIKEQE